MKLISIRSVAPAALCIGLALACCGASVAQSRSKRPRQPVRAAAGPKITVLDNEGLKKLLKPGSKPLMINFWATWCDPCREEFPDLVRLNKQYKGKIDFVTISLDDLADIDRDVPKFLKEMKADMPAYLLHAADVDAAIALVSADWAGNLPLTIVFKPSGETGYIRKGKIHIDDVTLALDKLLAPAPSGQ